MARRMRQILGGVTYHVLNRAVGRMRLFRKAGDYAAFQRILLEAHDRHPVRVLGYCVMPNHWHMVLWPREGDDVSRFMQLLTMTHVQRWRNHRDLVGLGPLYQGRFKSFPAQSDLHLLTVLRYVERNPLRASLVERAEDWHHCSLYDRLHADSPMRPLLHDWPIDVPPDYLDLVNEPQTPAELEAIHTSIRRGRPFGDPAWQQRMITKLGLEASVNPMHRPARLTLPPLRAR